MIKRKVRANWVELGKALARMDPTKNGVLDATKLRTLLFQFDIDMTARQWEQLITTLDGDGDGVRPGCSHATDIRFFVASHASAPLLVVSTCLTYIASVCVMDRCGKGVQAGLPPPPAYTSITRVLPVAGFSSL